MDGSSSSVSSMSNGGSASSRRSKIIGGIIGGAVGFVLLLLCIHCIVLAVRRRHRTQQEQNTLEYQDVEKAKHINQFNEAIRTKPEKPAKQSNGSNVSPRNPNNLSVVTGRLRSMGPLFESKPLPQEPHSAPSLAPKTPYVGSQTHHELPYFGIPEIPNATGLNTRRSLHVGAHRSRSITLDEHCTRSSAMDECYQSSPRILQSLGTPEPPEPRKNRDMRPNSDDPFM